jgi:hypothetical protein
MKITQSPTNIAIILVVIGIAITIMYILGQGKSPATGTPVVDQNGAPVVEVPVLPPNGEPSTVTEVKPL